MQGSKVVKGVGALDNLAHYWGTREGAIAWLIQIEPENQL